MLSLSSSPPAKSRRSAFLGRVAASSALALAWLACTPVEPITGPEDLPEKLGTLLYAPDDRHGSFEGMVWSTDRLEIYLGTCEFGQCTAKAVDVGEQTVREIGTSDGGYEQLVSSPDGEYLFYRARVGTNNGGSGLYRVPVSGGNSDLLVERVFSSSLSPEGLHVAYSQSCGLGDFSCDSLFLYDVAAESREFLTIGEPRVFSPDGSQLLFVRRERQPEWYMRNWQAYIRSIATGETEHVPLDYGLIRWDSGGISVLYNDSDWEHSGAMRKITRYSIYNVQAGTTTASWEYAGPEPDRRLGDWSADGSKLAFWTAHCTGASGFFSCDSHQFKLRVVDFDDMSERIIAVGYASGGHAAFSPDGRRIAYVLNYGVYMADLEIN